MIVPQRHRGHRDYFFLCLCRETRLPRLSPPASRPLWAGESDGGQATAKENQSALRAILIMIINVPVLEEGIKRLLL